jgi:hypothetical protein
MNRPRTRVALAAVMHESSSEKSVPTREQPAPSGGGGAKGRERSTLELRREAIRRWIDEDDDSACRGID